MKYTNQQWEKLTREQQRQAILNFQEPASIYKKFDKRKLSALMLDADYFKSDDEKEGYART